jgi:hypothetical protein
MDATIIGVALAVVSCAGGVYMGVWWCHHTVVAKGIVHKREMGEIFEEVKRLRAQVALHVGKE